MTDRELELRNLLVRAACLEVERQRAHQRQDWPAVAGIERELAQLRRRHGALEAAERAA